MKVNRISSETKPKKPKYKLYLTEFGPNGTNDLLIVDRGTGSIVDLIEETSFGYSATAKLVCDGETIESIKSLAGALDPELHTVVYPVSLSQVLRCICVSPVDPRGDRVMKELLRLGLLPALKLGATVVR